MKISAIKFTTIFRLIMSFVFAVSTFVVTSYAVNAVEVSPETRQQVVTLLAEDISNKDVPLAYSFINDEEDTAYDEWTIEELKAEIHTQEELMSSASLMAESARALGMDEQSGTICAAHIYYNDAKNMHSSLLAVLEKKEEEAYGSPIEMDWEPLVRSEFGGRIDPVSGQQAGHTGIDIAVPTGTAIHATQDGVVTKAEYHASYGNYVQIDHADGVSTIYAHNSRLIVSVGDTVKKGDIVSYSGSTGRSTGPHLHYEVHLNNQRVNPRDYLPSSDEILSATGTVNNPVWNNTIHG